MTVRAGKPLKNFFASYLANAPKDCLCRQRADLMDTWGVPMCRGNMRYIVGWLEEAADEQKLLEDPETKRRMHRYAVRWLKRNLRWLPCKEWLAGRMLRANGASRRWLIRRLVELMLKRAERGKE